MGSDIQSNKRCPKCGKLLNEDARSCNICGYKFEINTTYGSQLRSRIVMRKCSKCGTGFTIHWLPTQENYAPTALENRSKINSSRKKNRVGKIAACAFFCCSSGNRSFFAYRNIYPQINLLFNKSKPLMKAMKSNST
ncbi:MAG: zinc ribbon domain-containing protein [Ruminococcus sp.]